MPLSPVSYTHLDVYKRQEDVSANVTLSVQVKNNQCLHAVVENEVDGDTGEDRSFWKRLDLMDLAACVGLTWLVLAIWDHVLENM